MAENIEASLEAEQRAFQQNQQMQYQMMPNPMQQPIAQGMPIVPMKDYREPVNVVFDQVIWVPLGYGLDCQIPGCGKVAYKRCDATNMWIPKWNGCGRQVCMDHLTIQLAFGRG